MTEPITQSDDELMLALARLLGDMPGKRIMETFGQYDRRRARTILASDWLRDLLVRERAKWAAGLADGEALRAAIARIEESRQTHIEWRDHWREYDAHSCEQRPCPWESAREAEESIAGDMEHQERAIAEYDGVLRILRALDKTHELQPGGQAFNGS